jgi:hypothetical protein
MLNGFSRLNPTGRPKITWITCARIADANLLGVLRGVRNLPSSFVDGSLWMLSSIQPIRQFSRASKAGTNGLISNSGVPSTMSTSQMSSLAPCSPRQRYHRKPDAVGPSRCPCRKHTVRGRIQEGLDCQRCGGYHVELIYQYQVRESLYVNQSLGILWEHFYRSRYPFRRWRLYGSALRS